MKFRIKIALCMIGLVSVLFGIGESLLLKTSFDQAIDRERKELYGVYQMVSGTLQVAGDINGSPGAGVYRHGAYAEEYFDQSGKNRQKKSESSRRNQKMHRVPGS